MGLDQEIMQGLEKGQLGTVHKVTPLHYHYPRARRVGIALMLAGVLSGINWYFQNEVWAQKNRSQEQLIKRVDNGQTRTSSDFLKNFSYYEASKWQGAKVKLDGILGPGRFIVKRNRGNQQGYFVFAPYTVSSTVVGVGQKKTHRMFLLNLGWIPKSSKHVIQQTCDSFFLGENDYTEDPIAARRLNKQDNLNRAPLDQDQYVPISTVNAYIRTGEKQNKARGYINSWDLRLFKFIDLSYISRMLKLPNFNEASTIYLDRALSQDAEDTESLPIQTTKQQVISEYKRNVQWNEIQRQNNVKWVTAGSFVGALLVSLL